MTAAPDCVARSDPRGAAQVPLEVPGEEAGHEALQHDGARGGARALPAPPSVASGPGLDRARALSLGCTASRLGALVLELRAAGVLRRASPTRRTS